jgi:hypothetical protein
MASKACDVSPRDLPSAKSRVSPHRSPGVAALASRRDVRDQSAPPSSPRSRRSACSRQSSLLLPPSRPRTAQRTHRRCSCPPRDQPPDVLTSLGAERAPRRQLQRCCAGEPVGDLPRGAPDRRVGTGVLDAARPRFVECRQQPLKGRSSACHASGAPGRGRSRESSGGGCQSAFARTGRGAIPALSNRSSACACSSALSLTATSRACRLVCALSDRPTAACVRRYASTSGGSRSVVYGRSLVGELDRLAAARPPQRRHRSQHAAGEEFGDRHCLPHDVLISAVPTTHLSSPVAMTAIVSLPGPPRLQFAERLPHRGRTGPPGTMSTARQPCSRWPRSIVTYPQLGLRPTSRTSTAAAFPSTRMWRMRNDLAFTSL